MTTPPPSGSETGELLPCPFCGSNAVMEEVENGIGPTGSVCFSVGCASKDEESCMGYQSLQTFSRRSDAVKAWNTRAQPQADGEARQTRLAYDQGIVDRFADRVRPTPAEVEAVEIKKLRRENDVLRDAVRRREERLARAKALLAAYDDQRAALQKIADLVDSEAGEPLDDAIAIAQSALATGSSPVKQGELK